MEATGKAAVGLRVCSLPGAVGLQYRSYFVPASSTQFLLRFLPVADLLLWISFFEVDGGFWLSLSLSRQNHFTASTATVAEAGAFESVTQATGLAFLSLVTHISSISQHPLQQAISSGAAANYYHQRTSGKQLLCHQTSTASRPETRHGCTELDCTLVSCESLTSPHQSPPKHHKHTFSPHSHRSTSTIGRLS